MISVIVSLQKPEKEVPPDDLVPPHAPAPRGRLLRPGTQRGPKRQVGGCQQDNQHPNVSPLAHPLCVRRVWTCMLLFNGSVSSYATSFSAAFCVIYVLFGSCKVLWAWIIKQILGKIAWYLKGDLADSLCKTLLGEVFFFRAGVPYLSCSEDRHIH